MKIYFITLIFLLIFIKTAAQDNITSGYIKYTYVTQNSPFSNKTSIQNAFLNFNATESLFVIGRYGMDNESTGSNVRNTFKNIAVAEATTSDKGRMIYRNFSTKEIVYNKLKLSIFDPYIVYDNWVEMNWNLINETKIIAGYKTKKATTVFRGTKYTVWYSEEFNLPYGPLKLFGLPGIILESTTHLTTDVTFTAYEVCYPCENNQLIEKPDEIVIKTIEEEVQFKDNFQYYFNTEFNNQMKDKGILYMDEIPTEKKIQEKRQILPEKIYEWENKDTKRLKQGIDYKKLLDPNRKNEKTKPTNDLYFKPQPMNTHRF